MTFYQTFSFQSNRHLFSPWSLGFESFQSHKKFYFRIIQDIFLRLNVTKCMSTSLFFFTIMALPCPVKVAEQISAVSEISELIRLSLKIPAITFCSKNLCFISYPGWSPRANQRWTALFQRFYEFQRWSALFQNWLRKPALISAVSELFSAGFLWISAVQRWIKTNLETDENASCKFEKVLGLRQTCSFGVYQLWKNHSGEYPVKNSNWRTRLFLMLLGRTWPVE